MTTDQARQVAEILGNAKNELLRALRIAEGSSSAQLACQIGSACGRVETLQRKASEKAIPRKPTLRQFIRENRL